MRKNAVTTEHARGKKSVFFFFLRHPEVLEVFYIAGFFPEMQQMNTSGA